MNEEKTARLNIRLTPAEIEEVREAARAGGLTVSAYGRRRLLGHFVKSSTDAEAIRELRRIGGLLKHLHVESGGAYAAQTAAALEELRVAIRRVGQ